MTPSVGRIVHYVSYGTPGSEHASPCHAAVITAVSPWPDGISEAEKEHIGLTLDLCVLNQSAMSFNQMVPQAGLQPYPGGTWHWPERAE